MNVAVNLVKRCDSARIMLEVVGPDQLSYTCQQGALTDDLKVLIVEHKPEIIEYLKRSCDPNEVLSEVISNMPVTLDEVRESLLFSESDLSDISKLHYSTEALQMYVASWLLAGRVFPFILRHDWKQRL